MPSSAWKKKTPASVRTRIGPVVAPAGTVTLIEVASHRRIVALTPLKVTLRGWLSYQFPASSTTHPDLHSFPTRRSSDLPSIQSSPAPPMCLSEPSPPKRRSLPSLPPRVSLPARSEEHTSELQSRRELVCRLLLGKRRHRHRSAPG